MSRRKEEKEVYCLCRRAYDPNEFMIECDVCKEWFHGRYSGLTAFFLFCLVSNWSYPRVNAAPPPTHAHPY